MTQGQAQFHFWNDFGMAAYPNTAIPKDPILPYLTYQAAIGYNGDISNVTVQIWYKTESEAEPNAKVDEIAKRIGFGGIQIPCDGGQLWILRGSPWMIPANAQGDPTLKLRQLNVKIQHFVR